MRYQSGFTAVEVLVTLLIAFLLVGGAYQAYSVVVSNASGANDRNVASNLAYNMMRQQAAKVGPLCSPAGPVSHSIPSSAYLPSSSDLSTTRTCPYGNNSPISLVTTTITYGDKEVKHAVYASQ